MFRRIAFFVFFIFPFLLIPVSHAAFFDPKLHWKTLTTEHFHIHFHEAEKEVALRMADIAEKTYQELSPRLEWKPWGKTELVLTDHADLANGFTLTLPYNYILLFIESPEGTSSLNYYNDWLADLFTHELTHVLQIDKYGGIVTPFRWIFGKVASPNGFVPGWVREGIAVFEESKKGRGRNHASFSDMMLRTDILNHQFLTIDQAAGNAAYIYGGAFWQYLAETYGEEKITEFIRRYGDSMWLFSLNNKARNTFENKNFLKLWREWKESLQKKYEKIKEEISAKGLTPLETLVHIPGNLDAPTLSPDGKKLVYVKTDVDEDPQIRMFDLESKKDILLVKNRNTRQFSFSADGKKIVFASLENYKFFNSYYDLQELDLSTKKITRLTKGGRASDPDHSPDGKTIVFVKNNLGNSQLYFYDRESKKEKQLTHTPDFTKFSNPRFSPDGKKIVVSAWMNGNRDLYIYNLDGEIESQLTHDSAIDNEPRWSSDGKWIYFTSDRSGISNIYRQAVQNGPAEMISNVLTGLFAPQPIPGTSKMIAQHYFGKGYDIVEFEEEIPPNPPFIKWGESMKAPPFVKGGRGGFHSESQISESQPHEVKNETKYKIKKYTPWNKLFLPRYILPGFVYGPEVAIFSASTGSADPLGRHIWNADVFYRTDANDFGGDFTYTYNRWWTPFYLAYNNYIVSYGNLFSVTQEFFQRNQQVVAGVRAPLGEHKFDLHYTFDHVSDAGSFPDTLDPLLNLGNYAGFGLGYTFNRSKEYPASISQEGGPRIHLSLDINEQALGSAENNETRIVEFDIREYLKVPGTKHHVIALRAGAGYNFGDQLFQGVFRLGSALGEGVFAERTPRLYPLRGLPQITFAGDGALLFSGEYRLPLVYVDRGAGTGPIFLKKLFWSFFADYGTVFDQTPKADGFLLGVGAELRGEFIVGYGLPLLARLGYGIIVTGREFIEGLTDPVTGASIENGTLIFQFGTSF